MSQVIGTPMRVEIRPGEFMDCWHVMDLYGRPLFTGFPVTMSMLARVHQVADVAVTEMRELNQRDQSLGHFALEQKGDVWVLTAVPWFDSQEIQQRMQIKMESTNEQRSFHGEVQALQEGD